jgi:hypothetical protein
MAHDPIHDIDRAPPEKFVQHEWTEKVGDDQFDVPDLS